MRTRTKGTSEVTQVRSLLQSERGVSREGPARSGASTRPYFEQKVDPPSPALSVEWPGDRAMERLVGAGLT